MTDFTAHMGPTRRVVLSVTCAGVLGAWGALPVQGWAAADSPKGRVPVKPPADVLFGGSRYRQGETAPQQFALARYHAEQGQVKLAESPFFPHGWAVDKDPARVYVFEKEGPGAGVFDLRDMRQIDTIAPVGNRRFYGHGVLADQGRLLLSTESDANGKGAIGVRDPKTLAYLGDFPSYGLRPHDCHLVDGGRVLMVCNGGGERGGDAPCVTWIDVRSQKLLHRVVMPGQDYNTGHLAPVSAGTAVVVSAPRLGLGVEFSGAVSWCDTAQPALQVLAPPADLQPPLLGEALSVAVVPERSLVVVTHPTPGWLTFWHLADRRFLGKVRLERVRGVALSSDRQRLWVAHGAGAALGVLELGRWEAGVQPVMTQSMMAGSHLMNWPGL